MERTGNADCGQLDIDGAFSNLEAAIVPLMQAQGIEKPRFMLAVIPMERRPGMEAPLAFCNCGLAEMDEALLYGCLAVYMDAVMSQRERELARAGNKKGASWWQRIRSWLG